MKKNIEIYDSLFNFTKVNKIIWLNYGDYVPKFVIG